MRKIFFNRFALHLYFWIFVFLSFSILYIYPEIRVNGLIRNLVYLPADIAFTYFFLYGLNRLILIKKKFILFIFAFLLSIVVYTVLIFGIDQFVIPHILGVSEFSSYNLHTFFHTSWVIVIIALAAGYIKMIRIWNRTDKDKMQAQLERTQAYNQLLRSKINPHFLFNTLNNITSLLEFDKEKARESTLRLGELMAYMVYEADDDFVPLEKEISYIRNFIALQSLRIDKEEFVRFQVEGNPDDKEIGSMLLIPFVENSFKYCDANECPGIFMGLNISGNNITFKTENRVSEKKAEFSKQGGFGLENVKKRLEQLYPKSYKLEAGFVNQFYKVKLEINLSGRKKF